MMFRTACVASLLAVAALGCSSSDGGDDPADNGPGIDRIDGPATVDEDEADAEQDG